MRIRILSFATALAAAMPVWAQIPSSMGPNDLESSTGATVGTAVPRNELPTAGAGIAIPNSAGDLSRPTDRDAQALQQVRAHVAKRRDEAMALAERVRNGAEVPAALVPKLREALAGDLEIWRAEFQVGNKEANAMRDRWLRDPSSLSAAEWVLWRAAWYDERDQWIARTQSASR